MYELERQVVFSMCDEEQKLTVGGLIDFFQDVCNAQSAGDGVGSDYMTAHGMAWILNAWNVHIKRLPGIYEKVKTYTWPYEFKGFFGLRNFKMLDESGEVLAFADSTWTLIDIRTGRPVRHTEEMLRHYKLEPPYPMEQAGRKLPVPESGEQAGSVQVRRHHLDLNHHMNNVQYVREAADCLPDGFAVEQIMVEYRRQTRLGERMEFYKTTEENCVTIVMRDSEDAVHAILKFYGKTSEVESND